MNGQLVNLPNMNFSIIITGDSKMAHKKNDPTKVNIKSPKNE